MVAVSIAGILLIIILTGFLSGFVLFAVRSWIFAFRSLKKVLCSAKKPAGSGHEKADQSFSA